MAITLKQYSDFLASAAGVMATSVHGGIDTSEGSVPLAWLESTSLQDYFLQSQILQTQVIQRAATATGSDLDSFFADFGFSRLPATYGTGQATFTRLTVNASSPLIPVGTLIQTGIGAIQYAVAADTTNSAYSGTLGGYPIASNAASVTVTIQAVAAGTTGNLNAGTLSVIVNTVPGVDTVNNASPIANALNAELDPAARVRFSSYFSTLSKATSAAIDAAIASVQQGLSWIKLENENFDGTAHQGFFTVIGQDGSGGLTTQEQTNISSAINLAKPFTVAFALQAPTNISANVAMTAVLPSTISAGDATGAKAAAFNAVSAYINALLIGQSVEWFRCGSIAINAMVAYLAPLGYATAGTSVNGVTVNGAGSDLTIAFNAIARAGTVTVS